MSARAFNSLPNREYSNPFNATAFSRGYFSAKSSLTGRNSYLLTFSDDKTEILEVGLSKLYPALFWSILLSIVLNFSPILIFVISSS